MHLGRPSLLALSLSLLFAACGGEPEVVEPEPEPTAEPTPEDDGLALGSAADMVEVSEDLGSQLALLGNPTPEPEPEPVTPKPKPRRQTDSGLGVAGGRTLSATDVKATIQRNSPQVKACYERELKSTPSLRGKVVMAWTIGADGKVRSPRVVRNTTGNRDMLPCIKRAVAGWRFKSAESPQDIEYPFVFKSREY